ncbi:DUF3944 domain-containing protein [Pasteurellaceae bacterium HPA106]|uniref:DUF3944 domain-containing protein n=1 Tax=Spirabiliibacterium pneumoniae TaxID=221400 RepID=UPI001AACCF7D|nr:DUF3944 domain-containing protein [Spirabiliibacterium pneumoniae]MBE2895695.1 DUF3944 domain-containing protein [Spirabiliibacterium pneumoniae]
MAYRYDADLEFLKDCSSKDLDLLVTCLTKDKDGDTRLTETLTSNDLYKRYYPDHNKYWQVIAEEIQTFGGNTFANILIRRGKGVVYREVLKDVCDKLKVNYAKEASTARIEENLFSKILSDAIEKMSHQEIEKLGHELGLENISTLSGETAASAFITLFRAGGFKSYKLMLIIVNAISKLLIGRGLALAANAGLARGAAILTGPIGWVITGIWAALDIAGPAYRVTIPAVIQVAYLRFLMTHSEFAEQLEQKESEENKEEAEQ